MSASTGVPLRLSNFIGRKREMGELRRLLTHTRLLTMLGPRGAGKTHLATEFARRTATCDFSLNQSSPRWVFGRRTSRLTICRNLGCETTTSSAVEQSRCGSP